MTTAPNTNRRLSLDSNLSRGFLFDDIITEIFSDGVTDVDRRLSFIDQDTIDKLHTKLDSQTQDLRVSRDASFAVKLRALLFKKQAEDYQETQRVRTSSFVDLSKVEKFKKWRKHTPGANCKLIHLIIIELNARVRLLLVRHGLRTRASAHVREVVRLKCAQNARAHTCVCGF